MRRVVTFLSLVIFFFTLSNKTFGLSLEEVYYSPLNKLNLLSGYKFKLSLEFVEGGRRETPEEMEGEVLPGQRARIKGVVRKEGLPRPRDLFLLEDILYERNLTDGSWEEKEKGTSLDKILNLSLIPEVASEAKFITEITFPGTDTDCLVYGFIPSNKFLKALSQKWLEEEGEIKEFKGKTWVVKDSRELKCVEVVMIKKREKEEQKLVYQVEFSDFNISLTLSLPAGLEEKYQTKFVLQADISSLKDSPKEEEALKILTTILKARLQNFGLKGVQVEREREKIIIKVSKVKNQEEIQKIITKRGLLQFKLIWDDKKRLERALSGETPAGFKILYQREIDPLSGETIKKPYLVKDIVELEGNLLEEVKVGRCEYDNLPQIEFYFNTEGKEKLTHLTRHSIGKTLAIILDEEVLSAPKIHSVITKGVVIIKGNFSLSEAEIIAVSLKGGTLPLPVKVVEEEN